eukprot:TRINITY_DN15512_c0_g1_i1.p1 TRINITY_DN15512_c0_g1~~TRINITY_DN15512_c0_g1_i1.p1  ORF type:complete len:547 (+),score=129.80 TRINITY_DN15512_c0_g1_i1:59-1699(+)
MESGKPQWKVRLRAESGERFELSAGDTVLGRSFPTKWDEKLIPRTQIVVNVDPKLRKVTVKRVSEVPATLRRHKFYEKYIELPKDKVVEVENQDILCLALRKYFIGVEMGWNLPQTNARPVWLSRPRPPSPPRVKAPPPPKRKTTPPASPKQEFENNFEPSDDDVSAEVTKPPPTKLAAAPPNPSSSRPTVKREDSLELIKSDESDEILDFNWTQAQEKRPPHAAAIVPETAASAETSGSVELVSVGRNTDALARQQGLKPSTKETDLPAKSTSAAQSKGPRVKLSAAASKAKAAGSAAASSSSRSKKTASSSAADSDTDDAFEEYRETVQPSKAAPSTKKRKVDEDTDEYGFRQSKELDSDDQLKLAKRKHVPTKSAPAKASTDDEKDSDSHSSSHLRSSKAKPAAATATAAVPKPNPPVMALPQKKEIPMPIQGATSDEEYHKQLAAYFEEVEKNDLKYDEEMARYLEHQEGLLTKTSASSSSASSKPATTSTTADSSSSNAKKRKAESSTAGQDDRKKKSKTKEELEEVFGFPSSEAIDLTKS